MSRFILFLGQKKKSSLPYRQMLLIKWNAKEVTPATARMQQEIIQFLNYFLILLIIVLKGRFYRMLTYCNGIMNLC